MHGLCFPFYSFLLMTDNTDVSLLLSHSPSGRKFGNEKYACQKAFCGEGKKKKKKKKMNLKIFS